MAFGIQDETDGPSLPVLSSKRFPHTQPIKFPFTAYSSPHDLLAVVTTHNDISVFRIISGQVAFTVKREHAFRKGIEVTTLSWKADGTCLGVGWIDGKYGIYDGGSGKQLALVELSTAEGEEVWKLSLPRPEDEEGEEDLRRKNQAAENQDEDENEEVEVDEKVYGKAEVMGWMGHHTDGNFKSSISSKPGKWFDGLDESEESGSAKISGLKLAELSRAITTLDMTKSLPRLSAVSNHITKGKGMPNQTQNVKSVWQTQQGTDSIFEVGRDFTAKDAVQSLLVGQDDGSVQVLVDETVHVGSCNISGKPVSHAAHPNSSSHAILSQTEDQTYMLNFIDLPLSTLSGPLLHVIATNTKRMQTLLDYVVQTVRCIQFDYQHNIEIPSRYMRSLSGDLEDTDLPDVIANFYHLAMTGTFPDKLLEWLKDVLQDRGQKRWEEHINNMYRHIQDHLFMNLLPALDRFSIAVTTLRGHATFYEGSSKFDCPPELFTKVLDQIDCLRLVAHKMLLITQTEHRQFRAFNKWLKLQMEVAAAEPFSSTALESEAREVPSLDHSLLLPYIRDVLTQSKLAVHILNRPGMEGEVNSEEFWSNGIIRDMKYEMAKEVIQREHDPTRQMSLQLQDIQDTTALLNLPAITCSLIGHVRMALKKITDWQSRMLSRPTQLPLDIAPDSTFHDMTMLSSSTTSILTSHPTDTSQITLTTTSPTSSPTTTQLPIPPSTDLISVKWLAHTQASAFLTLSKVALDDEDDSFQTQVRKHDLHCHVQVLHVFPGNASFKPEGFVVGGRKDKMLCVVFGNKGREWKVLDLDAGVVQTEAEEEEEEEEDGMEIDDS